MTIDMICMYCADKDLEKKSDEVLCLGCGALQELQKLQSYNKAYINYRGELYRKEKMPTLWEKEG